MSLDSFKVFKDYIKKCVLEDSEFQKLIYYPYSNCLDMDDLENPYDLFSEDTAVNNGNGVHGVLLFKRRADIIMNAEMPVVLVTFEATKKSKDLLNVYIVFRIICKGNNVQYLNDGSSRIYSIKSLINDNLEGADINGLGKIEESSFQELSINEENDGMLLIMKGFAFNSDWSTNKNFKKRIMHQ